MTKTRKIMLFAIYALVAGGVLLFMLFPTDVVRSAIVEQIERNAPDLEVTIGELKLTFPPALLMKKVIFSKKDTVYFSADRITLQPGWISLFTSRKAVGFHATAYEGALSGVVYLAEKSEGMRFSGTGVFSELRLEQIPVLRDNLEVGLSGRASGQFNFEDVAMRNARVEGKITVTDCTVTASEPILELSRLSFQKIDLPFSVEGNTLELQQGDFQGTEFVGTFSGSIVFETPTDRSVLDLDINVAPQRLFLSELGDTTPGGVISSVLSGHDKFNMRVTGLLETPRVALGPVP